MGRIRFRSDSRVCRKQRTFGILTDLADYWEFTEAQEFDVSLDRTRHLVGLSPDLAKSIVAEARRRGLSSETLVNLWLAEKLRSTVT